MTRKQGSKEAGGQGGREMAIKHYKDLDVYKLSYELAMKVFRLTRDFPKEEASTIAWVQCWPHY